jgi:hypothetical protein
MVPVDTTFDADVIEDDLDMVRVRREAPELKAKHNHPAFFSSLCGDQPKRVMNSPSTIAVAPQTR